MSSLIREPPSSEIISCAHQRDRFISEISRELSKKELSKKELSKKEDKV